MDQERFRNPSADLRPAPFWAINGELEPGEVAGQMDGLLEAGFGGAFFHARAGLATPYLGEEWFASLRAALEAARRRGGFLWLYDEDLWPSGNAGGLVAAAREEYREARLYARLLAPGEAPPPAGPGEAPRFAWLIDERDGLLLKKARPLEEAEVAGAARGFERLLAVRRCSGPTPRWSGESYANLLDPDAVALFIELTHEVYRREVGADFGGLIPGIFTDEPHLSHEHCLPWYDGLPARYRDLTGRELARDLPYLYFDGPEAGRIRLLVHRVILGQFLEAYSRTVYRWCDENGLAHTGHYNAEDTLSSQIKNHCGGVMAHYRYMHVPGIDHLCRDTRPLLLTCKQVSSAARQLGRERVLTEIFGVTRHTATFEDFKALGDYNLVMGANFFCPHLAWYSAKGKGKRDYPPAWNYQQTYWADLPPLNDYFARLCGALRQGRPEVPVLLLHPIESAIAARRIGVAAAGAGRDIPESDLSAAEELDGLVRRALEAILGTGRDCDLGDENIIAARGKVRPGLFSVGLMSYPVVVVPPSFTWRETTVRLLESFAAAGGALVVLGRPPDQVDGVAAGERWQALLERDSVRAAACSAEAVRTVIRELLPAGFELRGADGPLPEGTYLQHRREGEEEIFFVVNSDRSDSRDYRLSFRDAAGKKLFRWEALDGAVRHAGARRSGNGLVYRFTLPPAGSALLTLSRRVPGAGAAPRRMPARERVIPLEGPFAFERRDKNVLVLDRIAVSFDDGKTFRPEEPEWRARKNIAGRFGTAEALGWQPWVAARKGIFAGRGGPVVLRYRFDSELERPESRLVLEDMEKGQVRFNGVPLGAPAGRGREWHWDRGFPAVEVGGLVRCGENLVDFAVPFDYRTEVEAAYLVGEFGVSAGRRSGRLVPEPRRLEAGSWVGRGYPFYSGRMVYRAGFRLPDCRRVFLRLIDASGVLFAVRVNGRPAGKILWRPHRLEITPLVRPGARNRISVELVSSLQNSWGPLHERSGDDNAWCGPGAFTEEALLREELSLFNYGLGGMEIVFS